MSENRKPYVTIEDLISNVQNQIFQQEAEERERQRQAKRERKPSLLKKLRNFFSAPRSPSPSSRSRDKRRDRHSEPPVRKQPKQHDTTNNHNGRGRSKTEPKTKSDDKQPVLEDPIPPARPKHMPFPPTSKPTRQQPPLTTRDGEDLTAKVFPSSSTPRPESLFPKLSKVPKHEPTRIPTPKLSRKHRSQQVIVQHASASSLVEEADDHPLPPIPRPSRSALRYGSDRQDFSDQGKPLRRMETSTHFPRSVAQSYAADTRLQHPEIGVAVTTFTSSPPPVPDKPEANRVQEAASAAAEAKSHSKCRQRTAYPSIKPVPTAHIPSSSGNKGGQRDIHPNMPPQWIDSASTQHLFRDFSSVGPAVDLPAVAPSRSRSRRQDGRSQRSNNVSGAASPSSSGGSTLVGSNCSDRSGSAARTKQPAAKPQEPSMNIPRKPISVRTAGSAPRSSREESRRPRTPPLSTFPLPPSRIHASTNTSTSTSTSGGNHQNHHRHPELRFSSSYTSWQNDVQTAGDYSARPLPSLPLPAHATLPRQGGVARAHGKSRGSDRNADKNGDAHHRPHDRRKQDKQPNSASARQLGRTGISPVAFDRNLNKDNGGHGNVASRSGGREQKRSRRVDLRERDRNRNGNGEGAYSVFPPHPPPKAPPAPYSSVLPPPPPQQQQQQARGRRKEMKEEGSVPAALKVPERSAARAGREREKERALPPQKVTQEEAMQAVERAKKILASPLE